MEITDTIARPPAAGDKAVWRRWHGGVVTATAYQMGCPRWGHHSDSPGYASNPWRGIRLTVRETPSSQRLG